MLQIQHEIQEISSMPRSLAVVLRLLYILPLPKSIISGTCLHLKTYDVTLIAGSTILQVYLDPIVVRDRNLSVLSAGQPDQSKVLEKLAPQGPATHLMEKTCKT